MDKNELIAYGYSNLHGHTDLSSNLRFLDSTITVPEMLDYGHEIGLKMVGFTGHEAITDHFKANQYYHQHQSEFGDMKLVLGNEIYLVNKNSMEGHEENNDKFRFNHFLLNALDAKGHDFLQKQSSMAWSNYHWYRGMERVPSYYEDIEKLMANGDYRGHVIASTACLGSYTSQEILAYNDDHNDSHIENIKGMIEWMTKVFGKDNIYLELMPSHHEEQIVVNNALIELSGSLGVPYIITTDAHYLNEAQRPVHSALLHSRNADRDLTAYDTAHLFSVEELFEFFDDDILTEAFKNLHNIYSKVKDYSLEHTPIVPTGRIPEFKPVVFKESLKDVYPNIYYMATSQIKTDKYLIKLAVDGMNSRGLTNKIEYWKRLDLELGELVKIKHNIDVSLSSYFVAELDLINIAWDISLVGPGRGSSSCWLLNYLLGLTDIDAEKYKLPHYRFLSAERVSENTASQFPDIDEDMEGNKREDIMEHIKEVYGSNKVLNFATFSTVASRSAIQYAGRGLGIDRSEIDYIVGLLPADGHNEWPVTDAINGNKKKNREPSKKFLTEVNKHPMLKETILGLFGLVVGRSEHASGVMVANDDYTTHNAMMKTTNGISVTQFDADDSEAMGMIKFDLLSIDALDRVRTAMNLLLDDKQIEYQGTLRATYEKYFGADKLDYTSDKMYDMLFNDKVINAFQFSSAVGNKALHQLNARSFMELVMGNGLMRLTGGDTDELALDRFIRYVKDGSEWDKDMREYGLNDKEMQMMHDILDDYHGVDNSQERLMQMVLQVADYSLEEANKLRKSIAKKDKKKQEAEKEHFFTKAKQDGMRDEFARYIWNEQIAIQSGWTEARPF